MPLVRPLVAVAALLLASCDEQSNVDPDAVVTIRGTVTDADGSPLEDRPVRLGSGVSTAEGGLGVLTVGLACLGGGCTGESFDTTTGGDGAFSFSLEGRDTQSDFGEAESFSLSTSAPPAAGRTTGPALSARFRVQTTTVDLPALALVDVIPTLDAGDGGSIRAAWDGRAAPGPYRLRFVSGTGVPTWELATAEPAAAIDGRVLEDATGIATVSTRRADAVEGSEVEIEHHSSGIGFHGGFGPPPTRGGRCEVRSDAGAALPVDGCPLTDGDFSTGSVPAAVCATTTTTAPDPCAPATRVRIELAAPMPAQLAVVRGCSDPCRVAVVGADGVASDVGPISGSHATLALDERQIHGVEVASADVTTLTEVSAWPTVSAGPPLLATPDRADLGLAEPDEGGRLRTVVVAVLVAAALGAGILIGRRSRRRAD